MIPIEGLTSIIASNSNVHSPRGDTSSLPYLLPYYIITEEPTFPSEILIQISKEELTSLIVSEPNIYSPSGDPSRFPYLFPSEIESD